MANPTKWNLERKIAPRILARWQPGDLKSTTASISKTNFRFLSSYSWLSEESVSTGAGESESSRPSIVVPGYPRRWDPPNLPQSLAPDSGLFIITQNAYRLPKCPIEPLLQALLITQPTFNLNEIHIICDRNVLQNLYRFVSRKARQDFEIGIEMVNNTALFTRLDGATSEMIDPTAQFSGYGHAFEKGFTKASDAMQGMGEHYRIVGYTFGGLNLVVRFITDAVTPTKAEMVMQHPITARPPGEDVVNATNTTPTPELPLAEAFMDKLAKQLSQLAMGKDTHAESSAKIPPASTGSPTSSSGGRLSIHHVGDLVPQEHIIELKTSTRDCTAQRWFSNTRHLYIGVQKKGTFTAVTKRTDDDATVTAWEQSQKEPLGKLAALLGWIIKFGKRNEENMRIRCVKGTLILQNWDPKETATYQVELLPIDLKEKWQVAE